MEKYAVIVAGGSGTRMGSAVPKQFMLLKGKPLLWYTLTAFIAAYHDIHIILVLPEQHLTKGYDLIRLVPYPHQITLVTGGATRFHSVKNGLQHVTEDSVVFVHDGVRCLLSPQLIQRCYEQALINGNAIPAVGSVDSIRIVTNDGNHIVDRNHVRIIQTPQTFRSALIKKAYEASYEASFTDEAGVFEKNGFPIHLVEGETFNIKITHPIDLLIAGQLLEEREA